MRCIILLSVIVTLVPAQAINESRLSVKVGARQVQIGQTRAQATRGVRTQGGGVLVTLTGTGVQLVFNGNKVAQIVVRAPYKGKTLKGIGIGSRMRDVTAQYREIRKPQGIAQARNIAFELVGGKVRSIRVNGQTPAAAGGRVPGATGGGGVLPVPNRPVPTRPPVSTGRPFVVWEHQWRATPRKRWISVPKAKWPKTPGSKLLVRVAYGRGVILDQRHASVLRPNCPSEDLPTPVDFLDLQIRRGGRDHTWEWCATGRGKVRVEVIWFPNERELELHVRRNRYRDFARAVLPDPAPPRPPVVVVPPNYDDLAAHVVKVWDHTWRVKKGGWTYISGPRRTWGRDGVLLVRAHGSRGVQHLAWKAGRNGRPHQLEKGDHLLDTTVLDRRTNPIEEILGAGKGHAFHFGALGHGRARVQVYWLPDRDIGPHWCRQHPVDPVHDVIDPGVVVPGGAVVIDPRRAPGHVTATFHGRLLHERTGVPVGGVDLIIQQQAWPRAVYGGVRTDAQGSFSIDVAVPIGTPVVIRVPAHNQESQGRAFRHEREKMAWNPHLR